MKRIALSLVLGLITIIASAQKSSPGTIKFLGIPVDGKKSELINALKSKGFQYEPRYDVLIGEFNGVKSHIRIAENKGKVWRIMVSDADTRSETQIRYRFNTLIRQFENSNGKYFAMVTNEPIPDTEDISYEITVHNKQYEASFFYNPVANDEELKNSIYEQSAKECLEYFTSVQNDTVPGTQSTFAEYYSDDERFNEYVQMHAGLEVLSKYIDANNGVWFTIAEYRGEYYINIYYDNKNNQANGEDL